MKTESDIKKYRVEILEQLSQTDGIEGIKYLQGISYGLNWTTTEEEKKEEEK